MNGRCHCGAVTVSLAARPAFMNLCNCSICFKLGATWSYYPADDARIEGAVRCYVRGDMAGAQLCFNSCETCGTTTHWSHRDPARRERLGVNMRLFDPAELAGIEVRYENGREDDLPGQAGTYREPTIFSGSGAVA